MSSPPIMFSANRRRNHSRPSNSHPSRPLPSPPSPPRLAPLSPTKNLQSKSPTIASANTASANSQVASYFGDLQTSFGQTSSKTSTRQETFTNLHASPPKFKLPPSPGRRAQLVQYVINSRSPLESGSEEIDRSTIFKEAPYLAEAGSAPLHPNLANASDMSSSSPTKQHELEHEPLSPNYHRYAGIGGNPFEESLESSAVTTHEGFEAQPLRAPPGPSSYHIIDRPRTPSSEYSQPSFELQKPAVALGASGERTSVAEHRRRLESSSGEGSLPEKFFSKELVPHKPALVAERSHDFLSSSNISRHDIDSTSSPRHSEDMNNGRPPALKALKKRLSLVVRPSSPIEGYTSTMGSALEGERLIVDAARRYGHSSEDINESSPVSRRKQEMELDTPPRIKRNERDKRLYRRRRANQDTSYEAEVTSPATATASASSNPRIIAQEKGKVSVRYFGMTPPFASTSHKDEDVFTDRTTPSLSQQTHRGRAHATNPAWVRARSPTPGPSPLVKPSAIRSEEKRAREQRRERFDESEKSRELEALSRLMPVKKRLGCDEKTYNPISRSSPREGGLVSQRIEELNRASNSPTSGNVEARSSTGSPSPLLQQRLETHAHTSPRADSTLLPSARSRPYNSSFDSHPPSNSPPLKERADEGPIGNKISPEVSLRPDSGVQNESGPPHQHGQTISYPEQQEGEEEQELVVDGAASLYTADATMDVVGQERHAEPPHSRRRSKLYKRPFGLGGGDGYYSEECHVGNWEHGLRGLTGQEMPDNVKENARVRPSMKLTERREKHNDDPRISSNAFSTKDKILSPPECHEPSALEEGEGGRFMLGKVEPAAVAAGWVVRRRRGLSAQEEPRTERQIVAASSHSHKLKTNVKGSLSQNLGEHTREEPAQQETTDEVGKRDIATQTQMARQVPTFMLGMAFTPVDGSITSNSTQAHAATQAKPADPTASADAATEAQVPRSTGAQSSAAASNDAVASAEAPAQPSLSSSVPAPTDRATNFPRLSNHGAAQSELLRFICIAADVEHYLNHRPWPDAAASALARVYPNASPDLLAAALRPPNSPPRAQQREGRRSYDAPATQGHDPPQLQRSRHNRMKSIRPNDYGSYTSQEIEPGYIADVRNRRTNAQAESFQGEVPAAADAQSSSSPAPGTGPGNRDPAASPTIFSVVRALRSHSPGSSSALSDVALDNESNDDSHNDNDSAYPASAEALADRAVTLQVSPESPADMRITAPRSTEVTMRAAAGTEMEVRQGERQRRYVF